VGNLSIEERVGSEEKGKGKGVGQDAGTNWLQKLTEGHCTVIKRATGRKTPKREGGKPSTRKVSELENKIESLTSGLVILTEIMLGRRGIFSQIFT